MSWGFSLVTLDIFQNDERIYCAKEWEYLAASIWSIGKYGDLILSPYGNDFFFLVWVLLKGFFFFFGVRLLYSLSMIFFIKKKSDFSEFLENFFL